MNADDADAASNNAAKAMKWIFADNDTAPVSAMLTVMETADKNTNTVAKVWAQKNYEAMKTAQRVVIQSTYRAQNGLMKDAMNVNAAIEGTVAKDISDEKEKLGEILDDDVRKKIKQEFQSDNRTGKSEMVVEQLKGDELKWQRVQFTSKDAPSPWDKTGVVSDFIELPAMSGTKAELLAKNGSMYTYTIEGDDMKKYPDVTQSRIRVMHSVLRTDPAANPLPSDPAWVPQVPAADFTEAIGKLKANYLKDDETRLDRRRSMKPMFPQATDRPPEAAI